MTNEELWREKALSYRRALLTMLAVAIATNCVWLLEWWAK